VGRDGSFQINIPKLETIRRLNLPIKFLSSITGGAIQATRNNYFNGFLVGSNEESGMTQPETTRVAEAFGLKTASIAGHDDIGEKIKEILMLEGPVVCDVMIQLRQAPAPLEYREYY